MNDFYGDKGSELCDLNDPGMYRLFLKIAFSSEKPLTASTRWAYYNEFGPKDMAARAEKGLLCRLDAGLPV